MKKIVAILAVVVVSAGAFAQTMDHSSHGSMGNSGQMAHSSHKNHGGMMQQMNNLTPEQQAEFNALHAEHMREKQKSMLDIKEINLKIQREMTADAPNQKNIDKLIDQRAKLKAQHQKDMLNFKLEMKEKFGIQMGGMMNGGKKCGMMG
jgi:Spy/CpxP family protein refolding chaperone